MRGRSASIAVLDKVTRMVAVTARPHIAWMLRGWDRRVTLHIDGERVGIVSSAGRAEVILDTGARPDIEFALSEKTLDQLIAGRLTPLTAKLTGRIRSSGDLGDILRFAAIFTACLQG